MTGQREGGCACGNVRYRLAGEPMITHACHCSFCQRETGGAFAVNMLYECDRVEWSGKPEEALTPSASGKGQRILRCPSCHVAVSSHYPGGGDALHFIRAGTLDDRSEVAPDVHIYTSSRQSWFELPEGTPAFDEFYDPADVWSEATMTRWKEAKGL
jgi:hypothetical protein